MSPGITALPDGTWIITGDTHISKWVREHGTLACDPALFSVMRRWLDKPDIRVVWDIGANIGDHTAFYLGIGKEVVAVEPNPLAFECLAHNCPGAFLLNAAASDAEGELRFQTCDNAGASRITGEGEIPVRAIRMDDEYHVPPPDFVKIDVEGWEPNALRGMETTLKTFQPAVFVEVNHGALVSNGYTVDDIINPLKAAGYSNFQPYPLGIPWTAPQFDLLATP